MAAVARHLHSIQGEQQKRQREATPQATPGDVDNYVDKKSEGILNCRSGGHFFPPQSKAQLKFTGFDFDANAFEREIPCVNGCGCIVRVELWQPVGSGKRRRWNYIGVKRREKANAEGETYAMAPGRGRAYRRDIKESMATLALKGITPEQIMKELGLKV